MSQTFDQDTVRKLIEEILHAKEEAEVQHAVEELLESAKATIQELSESLEAKDSTIEEMEAKIAEEADKFETAKSELEAKVAELEEIQKQLEEAQTTLAEIEKDRVAGERMEKLEEAKVARTGESRDVQYTKIREMTEEDFEEYAAELVSLRASLLEEIEAAREETEVTEEDEVAEEEVAEEEVAEEEEIETPPAEIDEEEAVEAALNMEVSMSDDAKEKWQAFAKAFTKQLVGTDEVED